MLAMNCFFGTLLVIALTGNISAQSTAECKNKTLDSLYPLSDPTVYYYCLDENTPQALSCPPGRGFQFNEEAVGCVPWEEWNCTYKGDGLSCTEGTEDTWGRHVDPTVYYRCAATSTPKLIPCPPGSGFAYTKDIIGCVPWDMWDCDKQIV